MASEHKNVNLSRCKTLHLVIRFISGVKQHIGQTRSHKNTACNVTKYVTILKASVEPCHNSTGNRYKDRDKLKRFTIIRTSCQISETCSRRKNDIGMFTIIIITNYKGYYS